MNDMSKAIRAKNICSLYRNGECIETGCPCHVLHPSYTIRDGSINCDYFLTAVLPADKELSDRVQAEIYQQETEHTVQTKKCSRCRIPFIPCSNRQRYCSTCAVEAERTRNAQSHRRQYWHVKT